MPLAHLRFRERVRQRAGATELLIFRIGDERFGVELRAVDEVLDGPDLRAIPDAAPALLGLIAQGERAIPLYSPATILGASPRGCRVALVMHWGKHCIALAADDAEEIILIEMGELRDPPPTGHDDEVVAGMLWREGELCTVLDARALVNACAGTPAPGAA